MRSRVFYLMLVGLMLLGVALVLLSLHTRPKEFTPRDLVRNCELYRASDWPKPEP